MGQRTALFDRHVAAGARMVDFHGWDMPLHYGSQLEEHHAVRRDSGLFDVSHMTVVDVTGAAAEDWLRGLLAGDVARLEGAGHALYTAMLDDDGGVLDDLIVYRREAGWRLVVNSATREKDLAWMRKRCLPGVTLREREELSMLAVQGPEALARARPWLGAAAEGLGGCTPFHFVEDAGRFLARTGYTGEDGFEVILPHEAALQAWDALTAAGVVPAGLGARDTLRLEAGMNLYGQDMDESVTPLESAMAWTVAFDPPERTFIGRDALERQKANGVPQRLVGLVLEERGVLRRDQPVLLDGEVVGALTSGAFSPTLGRGIGLARIKSAAVGTDPLTVEVRGRQLPVRVVRPPFVRHGRSRID
ncbi:MAG: glycine cleavage system aminomethyltransferase GcvT [Pseudomonadales bacterium]|nr:glycine cleavage system aminomethyltransferase GcvT [Pseudomonadales bacterium]